MKMEIEEEENKEKEKEKVKEKDLNSNKKEYKPILALMDDIPQINNILISIWGKHSIYDTNYYYRVMKKNLSYVYKNDKEVIAVCLINNIQSYKEINIDLICVKKEYQGKGLGKSLLQFCINNCINKGFYEFILHVATTNQKAIKLYKKLGFTIVNYIKNYYHLDKPPDNNAYIMRLVKKSINKDTPNVKSVKNNNDDDNIYQYHQYHHDHNNHDYNSRRYFYSHYHRRNKTNYNDYYGDGSYNNYYNNYNYDNYDNYDNYNNYNNNYYNMSNYREGYWRRYNYH